MNREFAILFKNKLPKSFIFFSFKKIDRVVEGDFGANLLPILDVLKTSGTIATYSSMSDMNPSIPFIRMMFMDITVRMVLV